MEQPDEERALLTRPELNGRGIRLSNTQLLRLEAAGQFPRRIYLTPARVVWYVHEIDAWIESRASQRAHRVYSKY